MKTTPVTASDIPRSVLSVPPLARRADCSIDREQNKRILDHLRTGGVSTFMYGGNANFYNLPVSEFAPLLEMLEEIAGADDWIIPSVGSDYGKAMDQIAILRGLRFPTAMVLPHRFPATAAGVATGIRRLADLYQRPVIAYVKDDGYIDAEDLGRLAADGAICGIKYAIVRANPEIDPYLEQVLSVVDRKMVISGIGERPAIAHLMQFKLPGFTSGSVCIAPRLSTMLLEALKRGDVKDAERLRQLFLPLEDLRDAHSPLRVLHEAVRLAGIAETGPILPYLSNITAPVLVAAIEQAAKRLLEANAGARKAA
jgi:dihydrodipicolinate synthase/N-acetylneuraminate lyase